MTGEQIPIVDHGALWCSCDTAIPVPEIAEACPGCGRSTEGLVAEAAYNAEVMAYVESKPIDWGLPSLAESRTEWWARMATAYEAARSA